MEKEFNFIKKMIELLDNEAQQFEKEKYNLDKWMKIRTEMMLDTIGYDIRKTIIRFKENYGSEMLLTDETIKTFMKQNNMKSILKDEK